MVNGEIGDRIAHAVPLVNQELTSEQELAMDRNTGVKIALETTKNQRFATLVSNVQLMANGEFGDLTARAVPLVNQELNSEHENVKEHYMVEKTALEMINNQRFVKAISNAQSMVNGEAGDLTAHAVLLVKQELNPEHENVMDQNTVVKTVQELTNKQRFVTPRSTVQSMENGEAGDHTAHVVLLANQELNSEPESVLVLFMVENIAPEMTNNHGFATPMSNVQSMVNGEVGHPTAHAVLLVNQELNSEQELARERNMEVKIALGITNNRECATPMSSAQSMVNGEAGDLTVHAALLVICLLYTSPSPRDGLLSRMPSSA